jgi:hypothetical protein
VSTRSLTEEFEFAEEAVAVLTLAAYGRTLGHDHLKSAAVAAEVIDRYAKDPMSVARVANTLRDYEEALGGAV